MAYRFTTTRCAAAVYRFALSVIASLAESIAAVLLLRVDAGSVVGVLGRTTVVDVALET